jgi:hypothetical protein
MSRPDGDIVRQFSNTAQVEEYVDQYMADAFIVAITNRAIETTRRRLTAKPAQKPGGDKPAVTCTPIHNAHSIRANGKSIVKWARSHKDGSNAAYEHIRVSVQHAIAKRLRLPKEAVEVAFMVDHGLINVDFGGFYVTRA